MATNKSLTSGRTRRAMKMGGLASQVGSSYLWTSLRKPFLSAGEHQKELLDTHIKNAMRIVEGSKELRGAFMKAIQMLSMREDILPGEALEVLKMTQSSVPPMDYDMITAQVRRELGRKPEQLFASFEREAFAAASLGQVHRAKLKDGREVAVKVQYPGVENTVEQDLQNLKLLLRALQAIARDVMRQAVDTTDLYAELEERLREELDYKREARNIDAFRGMLADDPDVLIPEVVKELSSARVLTMEYLDGYKLSDVMAPGVDPELKMWVAQKYFLLLWRQVLEFGVLHTDPHPGNYLVTWHPKLGILDFGSIRRFPEQIRKAYMLLARSLLDRNRRDAAAALRDLGYLPARQNPDPLIEILDILFEPAFADRVYDPAEYESVKKATQVSEITFQNKLYASPAHSVFLVRALIGLEGTMRQLGTPFNYRRLFIEALERAEKTAS